MRPGAFNSSVLIPSIPGAPLLAMTAFRAFPEFSALTVTGSVHPGDAVASDDADLGAAIQRTQLWVQAGRKAAVRAAQGFGSTAGCGKSHVRWFGRVIPVTRTPKLQPGVEHARPSPNPARLRFYAVRIASDLSPEIAACAAASLAIGTRYGEHDT